MKKVLCSFSILLMSASIMTGCTSIDYREDLKNKTIEAALLIPEIPEAEMDWVNPVQGAIYDEEVKQAYSQVDLKKIIIEEFQKYTHENGTRVKVDAGEGYIDNVEIPVNKNFEEDKKSNPRASGYLLSDVSDKIGKKYVFEFKVRGWGHLGKSVKSYIDYTAVLYDVAANEVVWKKNWYEKESFPGIMSTNGDAEDPENIIPVLRECVKGSIEYCFEAMNE